MLNSLFLYLLLSSFGFNGVIEVDDIDKTFEDCPYPDDILKPPSNLNNYNLGNGVGVGAITAFDYYSYQVEYIDGTRLYGVTGETIVPVYCPSHNIVIKLSFKCVELGVEARLYIKKFTYFHYYMAPITKQCYRLNICHLTPPTTTLTVTPTLTRTLDITETPTPTMTHTLDTTATLTPTITRSPTMTHTLDTTATRTPTTTHTLDTTATRTRTMTHTLDTTETPTVTLTTTAKITLTSTATATSTISRTSTQTSTHPQTQTSTQTPTPTNTLTKTMNKLIVNLPYFLNNTFPVENGSPQPFWSSTINKDTNESGSNKQLLYLLFLIALIPFCSMSCLFISFLLFMVYRRQYVRQTK